MQSLWLKSLCVFTSQCQSGLNVQGYEVTSLCVSVHVNVYEVDCVLGVADESYIKEQNQTKLYAAFCTGFAGTKSMKNAISKGVCVMSSALSVYQ